MEVIGMIADHPTPKFMRGGVAYTMNGRDYKAPMVVVLGSALRYQQGREESDTKRREVQH